MNEFFPRGYPARAARAIPRLSPMQVFVAEVTYIALFALDCNRRESTPASRTQ